MKQIIILSLIFLLLIPLTSSEILFKTNTQSDLQRPCFDNGNYCGTGFKCNITITRSDGFIIKNNQAMSRTNSYYNITLTGTDINVSAIYNSIMSCYNGTDAGDDTFTFVVNPQGLEQRQERTDTMSRSIYLLMGLGFLSFVAGFKFKFVPFRISFFILGAIFILIAINVMLVALQDEVVNQQIENLFDVIVAVSFYLYWFAAFILFVLWFVTALLNIQKARKNRKQRRIDGFG